MITDADAEKIADAILNRSNMGTATRIALRTRMSDGIERDLGGLNRHSLTETIAEAIRALSLPASSGPEQTKCKLCPTHCIAGVLVSFGGAELDMHTSKCGCSCHIPAPAAKEGMPQSE